jgi:hypothetical protein
MPLIKVKIRRLFKLDKQIDTMSSVASAFLTSRVMPAQQNET